MDFLTLSISLLLITYTCFHFWRSELKRRKAARLPPGPYPLPIIGNMLQLVGPSPHRNLTKLYKNYGPLMSLQLGSVFTVVVNSPELAREVLQKHDQNFSSRNPFCAAHAHDHHKLSVAYLPVDSAWKKLRKICKEQMFSVSRLDNSQHLRLERLNKMYEYVQSCSKAGRTVNINEVAFITTLNLMSATLFSDEFIQFDSDVTHEFKDLIEGLARIVGLPNLADYYPLLRPFDPQRIKKRAEFYFGKLLGLIEKIIVERLEGRKQTPPPPRKQDLLETLLDISLGTEYELTIEEIKHLLLDLFTAGSDTTASTTEWTMTELLLHPDKLAKVKEELRTVIGENKIVQESDISRLPYFQALIKEVFRYHPPGPFLIPRKAGCDVEVGGYTIPKGSQLFINVWAMGRDPDNWPNPESFEPERFLGKKTDFKGTDFELIPFGAGRRVCPGLPLANRMLHMTVATLVHNFNWKLEPGVKPEDLDTSERFGLSLRKAISLRAVPIME